MNVADRHQLTIARRTLRMSLAGARIMGGMTYAEAYRIVFGRDLAERVQELMAEYPTRVDLGWELRQYGYTWDDLPSLLVEARY